MRGPDVMQYALPGQRRFVGYLTRESFAATCSVLRAQRYGLILFL